MEFKTEQELENWLLKKQPQISQIIATRATSRVAPLMYDEFRLQDLSRITKNEIVLSIVSSCFVNGVAVNNPKINMGLVARKSFKNIRDKAYKLSPPTNKSAYASLIALSLANQLTIICQSDAPPIEICANHASATVDRAADAVKYNYNKNEGFFLDVDFLDDGHISEDWGVLLWESISSDAYEIENGMLGDQLIERPLWAKRIEPFQSKWKKLTNGLIAENPNWQFWIDWYQAILDGTTHKGLSRSQQDNLYLQIATFPNELWEKGAEAVNAKIAELLEEIKSEVDEDDISEVAQGTEQSIETEDSPELEIEPQTPGALRFKTNDDGKIDIDPAQDHDQVLADEGAKNRHEEVLHFGEELISLHDPSQPGANAVTPLIEKMTRCLEAMGNAPEEVDIDRLIPRGEALRQIAQREENRDDFSFTQPIPDHFQETLNNFLSAYNIYVSLDPVLDTLKIVNLDIFQKVYIIYGDSFYRRRRNA